MSSSAINQVNLLLSAYQMNQPDYHIPEIMHALQPHTIRVGFQDGITHINLGLPTLHFFNINFHPQIPRFNPISLLWLIPVFIVLFIIWKITRFLLRNKKLGEENFEFLEITPPSYTDKTAYPTQQLFSHLHGLGYTSKQDSLLGKTPTLSFEIVSTKTEGIRYLVGVRPEHVDNVKRSLLAYLPEVKIKKVDDYIPSDYKRSENFHSAIAKYGLSNSFGFPLKNQDSLKEHDPVAFLAGMMTQLSSGELISFQMILSPAIDLKERDKIAGMIERNGDGVGYMRKPSHSLLIRFLQWLLINGGKVLAGACEESGVILREVMSSPRSIEIQRANDLEYKRRREQAKLELSKIPTALQHEVNKTVLDKLNQSLFFVSLNLLVIAKDKKELKERVNGFSSFMDIFTFQGYQSLRKERGGLLDFVYAKL